MSMIQIYGLTDPATQEIRYIGKAANARQRYARHLREARTLDRPVNRWVRKLLRGNGAPGLALLAECPEVDWEETERSVIAKARAAEWPLLNIADGGAHIPQTLAHRQRAAKTATQKRTRTPEAKRLWEMKRGMAMSIKRGYGSPELRERLRSRPEVFGFLLHLLDDSGTDGRTRKTFELQERVRRAG